MVLVYDTESYPNDWFFCAVDTETPDVHVFHNEPKRFADWFEETKKREIFAAFNHNGYDRHILNAMLMGKHPQEIKYLSDELIFENKYPYGIKKANYIGYDIMPEGTERESLKAFEAFAGHRIKETSVDFDKQESLTQEEIDEIIEYCINDAREASYFLEDNKVELKSKILLCQTFDVNLKNISRTKAGLTEVILGAKKKKLPLEQVPYVLDYKALGVPQHVLNYYNSMKFMDNTFGFYLKDASGIEVEHSLGAGGLHGARKFYYSNKPHVHKDITSFYPNIMRKHGLLSRAIAEKEIFSKIVDMRVNAKKTGNKALASALKVPINAVYGISGAEFSAAYDRTMSYGVTVNGQLMMITLMIMIAKYAEIINSNTDGLILYEHDSEMVDVKFGEWCDLTGMEFETHEVSRIIQKDVNNYYIEIEGDTEEKGSFFRQPTKWRCNLAQRGIANEALINHFKGIPIEKTIKECNELRKFQSIVKLSDKYNSIKFVKDRKEYDVTQKVNRVFAVKNGGQILKGKDGKYEKVGSVPDSCVIVNDDVSSWTPKKLYEETGLELDYKYYKDFAEHRLYEVIHGDLPDKVKKRMRVNNTLDSFF